MKLLILQGLPASGKTTWVKNFVKKNKNYVRVNRDDLRNMRGEYWVPKQEGMISDWETVCVKSSLNHDKSVIVDSTNLNPKYLERWKDIAKEYGATIEYKKFDVDVEECIKRDLKRENSVGRDVIMGMHDKYFVEKVEAPIYDMDLPRAIIVDVDGTLAHMVDRGPYDWDKVCQDEVDTGIQRIVSCVDTLDKELHVIIMTGRDGVCEKETRKWLAENDIEYDRLLIRPAGNSEKDSIIKERLYRENIAGKFNVLFVLDDRDQVVKMWRRLGLKCLQVAEGNF